MTIDAKRAKVFVNASGLNNFPSGPVIKKTGRKLIMVEATADTIALPTSAAARWITSARGISAGSSSRCRSMFSHITMPISTIVPTAMAMPDRDTMLASTLKIFIVMKQPRTASGITELMRILLRRCINIMMTTMAVTRTS